eukprot:TRINITY_DN8922_c0_g1_i1.p1 TRINITY_DN8922_c0_g1~~TRINITY_DN8922_c0_g1_i1.p1  ORF type:complete len:616 (-),score=98.25 TRINITY_DN8922_c0_g1_i1:454-2301(-)
MIIYDPGDWSVAFAFSLKGSVFPKAFVWAFPCSVTSVVLHIVFHENEKVMWALGAGDVAASVLGGFTFILGFLVVFRSQQAYSRWWEGGTLLQQLRGEWFNSYSCLLAFCNSDPSQREQVREFQHKLVRLFSLLYGCALQQVATLDEKKFEVIDLDGFYRPSMEFLQECPDRCEVTLQWIQRLIIDADQQGLVKVAPPILSRVFNELGNGIVNLNNARKITEFPIPFPLAQMITVMLLFHAMVTPVMCAATVSTMYWAAIITFVVTFSYWSINYIAVELEMPFGDDDNDLPLREMQEDMNRSLSMLMVDMAQEVPPFHFKEVHRELMSFHIDFDTELVTFFDKGLDERRAAKSRASEAFEPVQAGRRFSCAPELRSTRSSGNGVKRESKFSNSDDGITVQDSMTVQDSGPKASTLVEDRAPHEEMFVYPGNGWAKSSSSNGVVNGHAPPSSAVQAELGATLDATLREVSRTPCGSDVPRTSPKVSKDLRPIDPGGTDSGNGTKFRSGNGGPSTASVAPGGNGVRPTPGRQDCLPPEDARICDDAGGGNGLHAVDGIVGSLLQDDSRILDSGGDVLIQVDEAALDAVEGWPLGDELPACVVQEFHARFRHARTAAL